MSDDRKPTSRRADGPPAARRQSPASGQPTAAELAAQLDAVEAVIAHHWAAMQAAHERADRLAEELREARAREGWGGAGEGGAP